MGLDSKAFFEVGAPFDALVYDTDFPPLALARRERRLSTIVYCCDASALVGTIVGGRFVVRDGHHIEGERLRERYRRLAARR